MYICEDCHNKRQNRQALESQPLQYVNHKYVGKTNCPDCSTYQKKGNVYQYLNAYELVMELEELKEKLEKLVLPESFPIPLFASAGELLQHSKCFPAILNDTEAMQNALQYAAEIESILEEVQP